MHLTYVALHEVTWCMVVWCVRHDSGGDDDSNDDVASDAAVNRGTG